MLSAQELFAPGPAQALSMAEFLLNSWMKATMLLGVAGTLAAILKKAPASTRHLVWGIGLSALLGLPALSFVLPPLNVPLWPTGGGSTAQDSKNQPAATIQPAVRAAEIQAESKAAPSGRGGRETVVRNPVASEPGKGVSNEMLLNRDRASEPNSLPRWGMILLLVWLAGFLVSMSRWVAGVLGALMIARRSSPLASSECIAELADLSHSLALGRRVRLLESSSGTMPMTCGIIRPTIILPGSQRAWPPERRRVVLLHELSHVKRWDCLAQAMAQLVCAFYWLNPLVWLAARRLRLESENACDDAVIGSGTKASAYAGHLLEIARAFGSAHSSPRGALTIARPSQLESRLRSILNPDRRRRRGGERLQSALVSLGLLALALGLAAMTPYSRMAAAAGTGPAILEPVLDRNPAQATFAAPRNRPATDAAAIAQDAKQSSGDAVRDARPHDQNKPASSEDARPDGSKQTLEEKESETISKRLVESYTRSMSIETSTVDQDAQTSEQKTKSDSAVEPLTGALKDKDPGVRSNAIWALSVSHGKIAQDALITALKDEDPRVRAQAAWGLGMHGDKKAVEPLISALKDANPRVVTQAAWALGMRGDVRAVDALKALLNNPNDHVRGQAAWALGMLLMRSGGDGDGDGDEDEPDGDDSSAAAASPRPHPHPHPHAHANPMRELRRAN